MEMKSKTEHFSITNTMLALLKFAHNLFAFHPATILHLKKRTTQIIFIFLLTFSTF